MTKHEILAMTDEESQIKVDELLHPGNKIRKIGSRLARVYPGEMEEYDWIPDYPNHIAAAWELVGINPDWRWAVYELDGGGWCATPMKVIGTRGEHCLWDHIGEATGDTAQRAITRAFILAMES